MPREARVKDAFGAFHIVQRSSEDRQIFRHEADRALFWRILTDAREQFRFRLMGYCLLDASSYHLLVKLDGCDLSQLMKSINISYVMGTGVQAGLFRDRYQSELLDEESDVHALLSKLEARALGEDRWNSFCHIDRIVLDEVGFKLTEPHEFLQCAGENCMIQPHEVENYIEETLADIGISFAEMLEKRDLRNDLICDVRLQSTLSLKQIGALFGDLSESAISKIIKQERRSSHGV